MAMLTVCQVLNPPQAMATPQRQSDPAASYGSRAGPPPTSFSGGVQSPPAHQTHASQPFNPNPPPSMQQHERSFSQGPSMQFNNASLNGPPRGPPQGPSYPSSSIGATGPPQLSTLPFQNSHTPPPGVSYAGQQGGGFSNSGYAPSPTSAVGPNLPPLRPVFGLSLEQLFERDGAAVPMVVYQCIQAVDLFGLEVEGIYRISGTASHITKIKAMFDNGMRS